MDPLKHNTVIARAIPDSFERASLGSEDKIINLNLARQQHQSYLDAIRMTGVETIVLPANETLPDCLFVEDTAVVIGDIALITNPGAPSRAFETVRTKETLGSLGFDIQEIRDPMAKLDGGDVLFTGFEILIGKSKRTNQLGIDAVKAIFPNLRVVEITVQGPLHLTTLIGLAGEDVLCVSKETEHSLEMFHQIQKESSRAYKKIEVPHDNAANCIVMNGHLLCKSAKENPEDHDILKRHVGMPVIGIDLSEIEKAVGSLSCMTIRFQKPL